jgi:Phosphotransferase enzyme family
MAVTMSVVTVGARMHPSTIMSYPIQASSSRSSSSSSSSDVRAFEKLLRSVYHGTKISIQDAERLHGHLHRTYLIRTVGEHRYILKCPPGRDTKTLRCEQKSLETESRIIDLVKSSTQVPIPQRIAADLTKQNPISSPYLLKSYVYGTPLSQMSPYLSVQNRNAIDKTLGSLFWQLSSLRHNSFGLTHRVYAGTGHTSWREAFTSLLESALRDSEDMLVSLPYESIRYYTSVQAGALDAITEPRLVALEAGEPQNVLVDERTRQVTGLLGWADVLWGDPFLASVFASATDSFWEGYGGKYLVGEKNETVRQML